MKDKKKCFICNKDITKELPKIDVDDNYYCFDCYLSKCKKEIEEKRIEEISDLISNYYHNGSFVCKGSLSEMIYDKLFPKDSILLSKEEYENIYEQAEQNVLANIADGGASCHWCIEQHEKKASNETAEKILQIIKEEYGYIGNLEKIIAKQFGGE